MSYRELVLGLAARLDLVERARGEHRDERVVVEIAAVIFFEHGARLAPRCERGAIELEHDDVLLELRVGRLVGQIADAVSGDELLDLAHVLAARGIDPGHFGHARRDARQLAHCRSCAARGV